MTRSERLGALPDALAGAGLLLLTGGVVGLALAARLWIDDGAAFLTRNRAPDAARARLLGATLATALAFAGGPIAAWLGGRISGARVREIGLRLCPLVPAALASLLLDPSAWSRARLVHLVACGLLAGIGVVCLRAHGRARPLALERRILPSLRARLAPPLRALAAPRWLPAAVVVVGAAGYAAFFSSVCVEAHWNGHTRSYDLAIFDNLFWNIVHGGEFLRSTPASGGDLSHFGRHATLLAYILAPFYAIHPSAASLLVMQALLIGFAAVPLFFFASHHLEPWTACAVALAYLLYPPLHGANLYDFHFLSISPFFVFSVAHALETRSRVWLVLSVVLTLSCREDVAIAVAILGAYHVVSGRRVGAGLVLAFAGSGWFAATKFWLMPLVAEGANFAFIYQGLVPEGASGFGGVLQTLLVNPGFVLGSLLSAEKLEYALLILVPLALVPLRRTLGWLFLLPGTLFTLLSTGYAPTVSIAFQYTAFWSPYVFIAAVLLLRSDAFEPSGTRQAALLRRAWLGAFALLTLVASVQYGAIFQQCTAAGGFYEVFPFGTSELDRTRRRLREEVLARLPADAKVAASESLAPHVSNRATAYTLREGVFDAEYVVFGLVPEATGEHDLVLGLLRSQRFGVVAVNPSYALLRRSAATTLNPRLLEQLGAPAGKAP